MYKGIFDLLGRSRVPRDTDDSKARYDLELGKLFAKLRE
jgi:hypothetical protein